MADSVIVTGNCSYAVAGPPATVAGFTRDGMIRTAGVARQADITSLQAALTKAIEAAVNEQQLFEQLAHIIVARTQPNWVAHYRAPRASEGEAPLFRELFGNASGADEQWPRICLQEAAKASMTGKTSILRVTAQTNAWLMAVPLPRRTSECLLALYCGDDVPAEYLATLQLVACNIVTWDADRLGEQVANESRQLAALTDLISRMESCDDPDQACGVLVDRLQEYFGCEQVIAGLCTTDKRTCHVIAVSGLPAVDGNSERIRLAQAVLQESVARAEISTWPAVGDAGRHGLCAHRQFVETANTKAVLSMALRDESGEVQGAWLMLGKAETVHRIEARASTAYRRSSSRRARRASGRARKRTRWGSGPPIRRRSSWKIACCPPTSCSARPGRASWMP